MIKVLKKNPVTTFIMIALAVMFISPDLFAASTSDPIQQMKDIYVHQAQTNAFPSIILWIFVLGVALSFKMNSFMPFILAVIASGVIAVTPDIIGNFTYTNLGGS